MEPLIRKQTYINVKQNQALKRQAAKEHKTEAEIIRRAIDAYLNTDMVGEDPLLGLIGLTDHDPDDGAAKHDRYIYE